MCLYWGGICCVKVLYVCCCCRSQVLYAAADHVCCCRSRMLLQITYAAADQVCRCRSRMPLQITRFTENRGRERESEFFVCGRVCYGQCCLQGRFAAVFTQYMTVVYMLPDGSNVCRPVHCTLYCRYGTFFAVRTVICKYASRVCTCVLAKVAMWN